MHSRTVGRSSRPEHRALGDAWAHLHLPLPAQGKRSTQSTSRFVGDATPNCQHSVATREQQRGCCTKRKGRDTATEIAVEDIGWVVETWAKAGVLRLRLKMTSRRCGWGLRSRRAEGPVVHEIACGLRFSDCLPWAGIVDCLRALDGPRVWSRSHAHAAFSHRVRTQ